MKSNLNNGDGLHDDGRGDGHCHDDDRGDGHDGDHGDDRDDDHDEDHDDDRDDDHDDGHANDPRDDDDDDQTQYVVSFGSGDDELEAHSVAFRNTPAASEDHYCSNDPFVCRSNSKQYAF